MATARCAVDDCQFLATQGEFCLTHRPAPPPRTVDPRVEAYVARVVAEAPPLSVYQSAKIALLLRGGRS